MNHKLLSFFITLFAFIHPAAAQQAQITGTVTDDKGHPLPPSAVAHFSASDETKIVSNTLTDTGGKYQFTHKKKLFPVDSKPVPESSAQEILQMIPAGNISSIELITHPSSKYDATYGALINIITKKKELEGTTGNLRAKKLGNNDALQRIQ